MNYQPFQHSPTLQWSEIPGYQFQQTSQQHLPLQRQITPYRFSSPAVSPSLPQVSYSVMHLQSPTCPQSPLLTCPITFQYHTQYTLTSRLRLQQQSPKPLPTTLGRPSRRGSEHISQRRWLHEDTRPQFNSPNQFENCRISQTITSKHRLPTLTQQPAANKSHSCVYTNRPRYMYTVLRIIVTW
jgi:hypothetical protein